MSDFPATAPRLFIAPERFIPAAPLVLKGAPHHYLTRVLRLRIGDAVVLLDGQGRVGAARVARVEAEQLELGWESMAMQTAAGPKVVLLCGLLKGDKQDFVIQKATELGVHELVAVACQRSVPQLEKERAEKRQLRWLRIAQGAAQQCRRPDVPQLRGPLPLAAALAEGIPADPPTLSLLLYEGPAPPLHAAVSGRGDTPRPLAAVRLLIGPEGGFTDAEVAAATAAGFVPASLGPRILRAETAVVAALAVMQYTLDAGSSPEQHRLKDSAL